MKYFMRILCLLSCLSFIQAYAGLRIPMASSYNMDQKMGTIRADDTIYGVLFTPHLHHLPPGVHGFQIYDQPFCGRGGLLAGGHLDPERTLQHRGPYNGNGHLGDLPVLIVADDGEASLPVLAPRLKLSDILGHAVMIHVGGDTYSDKPEKMGGGGPALACGIIPYY